MTRRLRLLSLLLLATLAVDWSPGVPPFPQPNEAAGQGFTIVGPGGVTQYVNASVTCVNTTTACPMWTSVIPAGYMATGSTATGVNISTPPGLHYMAQGTLNTPSGGQIGTINMGANFGGTTATLTLLNAHTPAPPGALSTIPIQIDIWISDIATAANANLSANTVWLRGRVGYVAASGTETVINSQVIGTTALNVAQTFAVNWLWGSGSTTNSVTFYNQQVTIGN